MTESDPQVQIVKSELEREQDIAVMAGEYAIRRGRQRRGAEIFRFPQLHASSPQGVYHPQMDEILEKS